MHSFCHYMPYYSKVVLISRNYTYNIMNTCVYKVMHLYLIFSKKRIMISTYIMPYSLYKVIINNNFAHLIDFWKGKCVSSRHSQQIKYILVDITWCLAMGNSCGHSLLFKNYLLNIWYLLLSFKDNTGMHFLWSHNYLFESLNQVTIYWFLLFRYFV